MDTYCKGIIKLQSIVNMAHGIGRTFTVVVSLSIKASVTYFSEKVIRFSILDYSKVKAVEELKKNFFIWKNSLIRSFKVK